MQVRIHRGAHEIGGSCVELRCPVGAGVAGRVAQTGEAVHGPVGHMSGALTLGESEPRADSVISVPLKSQGRVIGVLNLYDRVDADEFDDSDLATIRSFANQATVAIDNVLLHQEAQRLSGRIHDTWPKSYTIGCDFCGDRLRSVSILVPSNSGIDRRAP